MSDWRSRITVEPGKLGGKPCVRGMRMSVADVLEYLAAEMSIEEVLADFPYLEREDILGLPRLCGRAGARLDSPACVKLLFDEDLSPSLVH